MIFEVEVYVMCSNCETVIVDIQGTNEQDAKEKICKSLNSAGDFVIIGSGVFSKTNVRGACIIRKKGK